MQHLALNVNDLDELYALRDRIRSKGVPVIGPMNHGMCTLPDPKDSLSPEVQKLAGISDEELARYKNPEVFVGMRGTVKQPGSDAKGPHLAYPKEVYEAVLKTPDEAIWNSVENRSPVEMAADAKKAKL